LFANPSWIAPAIQNPPHLNLIAGDPVIDGIGKTMRQHPKIAEVLPVDSSIEVQGLDLAERLSRKYQPTAADRRS